MITPDDQPVMTLRTTAVLVSAATFIVVGLGVFALAGRSAEVVQYPPGERPCVEATDALYAVTLAQLQAGPGPTDPDGTVRDALKHAQEILATYRAGESPHYSAATYQALASTTADTISPLIEAYEAEDPDTPYSESDGYWSASSSYILAASRLNHECTRTE